MAVLLDAQGAETTSSGGVPPDKVPLKYVASEAAARQAGAPTPEQLMKYWRDKSKQMQEQ